jgi:hypothetical protein
MALPNIKVAEQLLNDPYWRLNHLYYIIDKSGNKELFKLNGRKKSFTRRCGTAT